MQNEDGEEQFVCYNSLHGLPDNSIRSILEDDKGCIWIATNNGLSRFQPTENHFINYNRQDGLADTQFYWNAAHRSQYSKLYLGTVFQSTVHPFESRKRGNIPRQRILAARYCRQ